MGNNFTTVIGKDVIESLTIGMYEDSKFIFREYIQNSADQIDKGVKENLFKTAEIHISITPENKIIVIEDNATGIPQIEVLPILKNIAQSTKKRGIDKGFRGIGRLGGLGYCDKLIFETSFKGEKIKSIMIWDAKLLRKIINNRNEKEEASRVIDEVTSLKIEEEEEESHYFKVILMGVTNNNLLDVSEVRKYLSMVAPVPFALKFTYKSKIYEELRSEKIFIDEYKIFINTEQLFKGYSTYIYDGENGDKRQVADIIDVIFFKEYSQDKELLYWGWYGITEKNQSIKQINYCRGFRLRKSNIQIGDEFSLVKHHRDKRFQFYFIGEIYAFHSDLLPNARRDYFSENDTCLEFENKLKKFFYSTIYTLCHTTSEINSSVKKIDEYNSFEREFQDKKNTGFTDKKQRNDFIEKLGKKKEDALKAEAKLDRISQSSSNGTVSPISKILEKVAVNKSTKVEFTPAPSLNEKLKYRTDSLSRLTKEQRKFLGDIFTIINNVLPRDTAENLIQKIEEELK